MSKQIIWGYPIDGSPYGDDVSWDTWKHACIYFDEEDGLYYMMIDIKIDDSRDIEEEEIESNAKKELSRLNRIASRLEKFLQHNRIPLTGSLYPFSNPDLCANSITELYLKLRVMIEGYKRMIQYKVITENK